ncbi:hypothetical protein GE061_010561 [Apolygus lucorum]|uniref:Uncharacterized protein n=1 Tax=Apolygus lucorum TaxID=248454 RepID=A0A8S9XUY2_APOLU|nr:hypothetical protein GE061_010561 [Apolygus lucorum]
MKVGEEVRGYQRSSTRRLLDPAYTPDIAHLVHRGGPPPPAESKAAKSARARLAEVLSLTRTATRLRQVTQRKSFIVCHSITASFLGDERRR